MTTTPTLSPHACDDTSCEVEDHDRTCAVPSCDREIEHDATDVCDDHRAYAADFDPYE